MNAGSAPAPSSAGELLARPERPEDAPFLFRLFSLNAAAVLRHVELPAAMREQLVALQHRAQLQGYRSAFPAARFQVVELAGERVGRLVEDDEAEALHIVDIAFLPDCQGRGLGRTLISGLMQGQAAQGRGVRAQAAVTNTASLRLFGGLGFTAFQPPGAGHVDLVWRPAARLSEV